MPPHSLVLSFIGACLLWVGWFGFNAGSALASNSLATSAFVRNTLRCGRGGTELERRGMDQERARERAGRNLRSGGRARGHHACSWICRPMPALVIGFIAGACCYWMVTKIKAIFGYDDALDAFGVHGAGGTIGALLTGVFAQQAIKSDFWRGQSGGRARWSLGTDWQSTRGVLIAWGFALVGTIVLLKIVDLLTGVRVPEEHEIQRLDVTQHGEEAYNLEA